MQPATATSLLQGATATLTCAVFGEAEATVTWTNSGTAVSGATSSYDSGND